MVPLIWTRPALRDLEEIRDYISRDSPKHSQRTIKRIRETAENAAEFPESGHELPDLPESPYLQLLYKKYRVIYRIVEEPRQVTIMAVIHASRNLPPIMKGRME